MPVKKQNLLFDIGRKVKNKGEHRCDLPQAFIETGGQTKFRFSDKDRKFNPE